MTRKGCESCSTWAQMLLSLTGRGTHPWERRFGLEAAQRRGCSWQRGRTSMALALAMQRESRECAQLLVEAGANRAVPSADHDAQENIYFVGHQNTPEQRAAVDDLVSAHNADAHWLMWFSPGKALSVTDHVGQPPQAHFSWRTVAHCTQGVLCRNSDRHARESTLKFLKMYSRAQGCRLTVEYRDEETAAILSARWGDLQCQQDALQYQHVVSSKRTKF